MSEPTPASDQITVRKAVARAGALTIFASVVTLLFANGVLVLQGTQLKWALGSIVLVVLATMTLIILFHSRYLRALRSVLDARGASGSEEARRTGFAALANASRYWFGWAFLWFVLGTVGFTCLMKLRFQESYSTLFTVVSLGAGVAGGFIFAVAFYFYFKRYLEPARQRLAAEIGDPDLVRQMIRPVSLRTKLLVSVTGTLLLTTAYATLLGHVRSTRATEGSATRLSMNVLAWAEEEALATGDVNAARARARQIGLIQDLVRVDPKADPELGALGEHLAAFEIEYLRSTGLGGGDSRGLESNNFFAWKQIPGDSGVIVTVAPAEMFEADIPAMVGAMGGYLALASVIALLVAFLIADDAQRATAKLSTEVSRLASGDLTRGEPLVWEDELGELAGSVDHMAESLRAMVKRVAGTADRVDSAAEEIAISTRSVVQVSSDQVVGLEHAKGSMESIDRQMRGIADSAQALNVSVEDSSSSILELRSAGETLNDNASMLSGKVDETSSAIEELIRSVRTVLENTEHLAGAAVETSSSMEEMAASLREVDTNAVETARLSREVVTTAEGGRERVQDTIDGMTAIRDATESARRVIHSLGGRAKEIGAIVSVIDDVAEETNLLALNAAIIAAQAGENGRGFSIVADEIKKLADRVLSSTKEIAGLIQAVQEESTNAVGAIEAGADRVEQGVARAEGAGDALNEITAAARESGARIGEIVAAVGEQTKASTHVVSLMERVRAGVEQIRQSGREQDRGNESVLRSTEVMRQIAQKVHGTTGEQARGSGRISESIEGVREAMEQINGSLQEQAAACRNALEHLEAVNQRTRTNDESARNLDDLVTRLRDDAEKLRTDVQSFRI